MTASGDNDDLWANTRPEGAPQPDPFLPPDGDATPATGVPAAGAVPAGADPTIVQPAVTGGAGYGAPPPAPPGGGEPPADGDGSGGPPPWLLPAAIGLVVLLLIALGIVLVRDNGDDDTTSTLPATETTIQPPPTTSADDTTLPSDTTIVDTTVVDTTTTTTIAPTTTATPTTTTTTTEAPTTTAAPTTTEAPNPLPDPGFARIDDEMVPIEAACSVVSFAPADGDAQVTGFLMTTTAGRVQLDRWFDSGADGVDTLVIDTGEQAMSTSVEPFGPGWVATMEGGAFEIALNPPAGVSPCASVVQTSDSDLDNFPFNQGVLDLCSAMTTGAADLVYVATLTDQGRVLAIDFGDGTAEIQYTRRAEVDRFVGVGPWSDGAFEGEIANSAGETLLFRSDFDVTSARQCDPTEVF